MLGPWASLTQTSPAPASNAARTAALTSAVMSLRARWYSTPPDGTVWSTDTTPATPSMSLDTYTRTRAPPGDERSATELRPGRIPRTRRGRRELVEAEPLQDRGAHGAGVDRGVPVAEGARRPDAGRDERAVEAASAVLGQGGAAPQPDEGGDGPLEPRSTRPPRGARRRRRRRSACVRAASRLGRVARPEGGHLARPDRRPSPPRCPRRPRGRRRARRARRRRPPRRARSAGRAPGAPRVPRARSRRRPAASAGPPAGRGLEVLPLDLLTQRRPVGDLVGDHGVDVGAGQVAPDDPTRLTRRTHVARQVLGALDAAADRDGLAALEVVVEREHGGGVHAPKVRAPRTAGGGRRCAAEGVTGRS